MNSDFSSEMKAWWEVVKLRKWTLVFFTLVTVLMVVFFLTMVGKYRLEVAQVSQLSTQMEVIAEVNDNLGDEQRFQLQEEIEQLYMVEKVDYWSEEKSIEYINNQILPGYKNFLVKNQLGNPADPLFRITLNELGEKVELEKILSEKYPNQLFLMELAVNENGQSFARQFVENVTQSISLFKILIILQFVFMMAISGYLTAFVLSERSRGFHLKQLLHISPPYQFWPTMVLKALVSLVINLLALWLAYLLLGQFLLVLVSLLFIAFVLLDLILVWFGRFVVVKWGMR